MDAADEDLYGETTVTASVPGPSRSRSPSQIPDDPPPDDSTPTPAPQWEEEGEQDMDQENDSDSDLEIITDRAPMTLDNRPAGKRAPGVPQPLQASGTSSSLTTEYTPRERIASVSSGPGSFVIDESAASSIIQPPLVSLPLPPQEVAEVDSKEDTIDTSQLPPVTAPSSHPSIDPTQIGILDGRSIFEHDMDAFADKPWRKPGSNIADWFNYGFDEISWEAYCYRRRQLGEDALVLRANVINFSGLLEDQVVNLPPDARAMVMTGTTALMNTQQQASMMAAQGMPMGSDMTGMQMPMSMMQGIPMHPMMGGDMGSMYPPMSQIPNPAGDIADNNNMAGPGPTHQEVLNHLPTVPVGLGVRSTPEGPSASTATPVTVPQELAPNLGSVLENNASSQAEGLQTANATAIGNNMGHIPSGPSASGRGQIPPYAPSGYRGGRGGIPPQQPARGRAMFRGRGRGGMYGDGAATQPPPPIRPTSPLPPNVPTGPRSQQNRYKDRDGNTPGSDGLDYGNHNKEYHAHYDDDRGSRSRKRRASPPDDYSSRGPKRR